MLQRTASLKSIEIFVKMRATIHLNVPIKIRMEIIIYIHTHRRILIVKVVRMYHKEVITLRAEGVVTHLSDLTSIHLRRVPMDVLQPNVVGDHCKLSTDKTMKCLARPIYTTGMLMIHNRNMKMNRIQLITLIILTMIQVMIAILKIKCQTMLS